ALGEALAGREIGHEGAEIAVVDAEDVAAGSGGERELVLVVRLDQGLEPELARVPRERPHLGEIEDGGDEENGVRARGARFVDLVAVDHEVLPQDRHVDRRAHRRKVGERASEELAVRQDGDRRRARGGVGAGDRDRVVRLAQDALRRRPPLALRDHGGAARGERAAEAPAGHGPRGIAPKRVGRARRPAGSELAPLVRDDAREDVGRLPGVSLRAFHGHTVARPSARPLPRSAAARVNRTSSERTRDAAPDAIAARARSAPSRRSDASPATYRAAAAFATTTSLGPPAAPASTSRTIRTASARSAAWTASRGHAGRPKSAAARVRSLAFPARSSIASVGAESEISSVPSRACTTSACSQPRRASAPATSASAPGAATPITWRVAPAGFESGPSRLKTVRTPISLRAAATCRIAGWRRRAKRKAMPTSSRQRPTSAAGKSIATPSASSTSAPPKRPDAARFPCFATDAPAPAATSAAAVEMLNVRPPSPPVPQVSTSGARRDATRSACARMARAAPTTSSTVSPFARSAPRKAPT